MFSHPWAGASTVLLLSLMAFGCNETPNNRAAEVDAASINDAGTRMDGPMDAPDVGVVIPLATGPIDFVANRPNITEGGVPRICVSTHIPTGTSPSATTRRRYELGRLAALGVKYFRQDFYWHRIEPERGRFVFDAYDRLVDEAAELGIGAIGLMVYGNAWATSATEDDNYYPPDDPADYGNYVARTAQHFAGRVDHLELWNEANAGFRFFKPNIAGDPEAFAQLVAAAYPATKALVPDVDIAIGALFYHDGLGLLQTAPDFTEAMFQSVPELATSYDAIGVHPYPQYPPSVGPEINVDDEVDYFTMLDRIRAIAMEHTGQIPRLWVTEIGWPVTRDVDEAGQAAFLARSLLLSAVQQVEFWCAYTLMDEEDDGSPLPESKFGLLRPYDEDMAMMMPEAAEKQAYQVLQDLIATLDSVYAVRQVSLSDAADEAGVLAVLLYGKTGQPDRLALWSTGDPVSIQITPPTGTGQPRVHVLGMAQEQAMAVPADRPLVVTAQSMPTMVEINP